jgi:uncharacterized iron-regulated membrane protein
MRAHQTEAVSDVQRISWRTLIRPRFARPPSPARREKESRVEIRAIVIWSGTVRAVFVFLHRWAGLAMAGFPILVGLTVFRIDRPVSFALEHERGLYVYNVHSSRDPGENYGGTTLMIDAYSGALFGFKAPTGERDGETVTTWLVALHTANVFGLPYRALVCLCGLTVVLLSITGVVIWLKKRRARLQARRRVTAPESARRPDSRAPA